MKTTKKTSKPVILRIVFGSEAARDYFDEGAKAAAEAVENGDGEYKEITFKTQGEKNAYLQGLYDAQGWDGFTTVTKHVSKYFNKEREK